MMSSVMLPRRNMMLREISSRKYLTVSKTATESSCLLQNIPMTKKAASLTSSTCSVTEPKPNTNIRMKVILARRASLPRNGSRARSTVTDQMPSLRKSLRSTITTPTGKRRDRNTLSEENSVHIPSIFMNL